MINRIKVEYDPILGCVGWKFREQLNNELSKKRKNSKKFKTEKDSW